MRKRTLNFITSPPSSPRNRSGSAKRRGPALGRSSLAVLALIAAPAYGAGEKDSSNLADMMVTGKTNPIAVTHNSGGMKFDAPIKETPQSISVVSKREIEIREQNNVDGALKYTPGFISDWSEYVWTMYKVRGFGATGMNRDGLTQFSSYSAKTEAYGAERIELIKGAASVLFGAIEPGGAVNYVGKRPTASPFRELKVSLGNYAHKTVAGDFSGPINKDKTLLYRVTGLLERSGSVYKHESGRRDYLSAQIQWKPRPGTSVIVLGEYQYNDNGYGPVPVREGYGIIKPFPDGTWLPRDFYWGEPGYSKMQYKTYMFQYGIDHEFTPKLSGSHHLRYFHNGPGTRRYVKANSKDLSFLETGEMPRYAMESNSDGWLLVADGNLKYLWGNDAIRNTTIVGAQYEHEIEESNRLYVRDFPPLNIFKPVYNATPLHPLDHTYERSEIMNQWGVYAQNQFKIRDKWVLLAGGRIDNASLTTKEYKTGESKKEYDHKGEFTGRLGLVYLFDNGFAPYASFSQSFTPQSGESRLGKSFKPRKGEQYEIGARYQPPGRNALVTLALYNLERSNDLYTDPVDKEFSVQVGKTRSRGVEFEAKAAIGPNTHVTAGYAYTDARVVKAGKDAPPEVAHKRMTSIPYHQLSLWADHRLGFSFLRGVTIGAGFRFEQGAFDGNDGFSPTRTLVDAVVSYERGPWRLALNASNVLNDKDVRCRWGKCEFGEPRRFKLTGAYRW